VTFSLRRAVLQFIGSFFSALPLDLIVRGMPHFRKIRFGIESQATESETVFAASNSLIAQEIPIEACSSVTHAELRPYKPIRAHVLKGATVFYNRRFSPLLINRRCFVPERSESGPWDFGVDRNNKLPGSVTFQHGRLIAFRGGGSRKNLAEALYVGTRAPDNYYHWLTNALPSLHLASKSAIIPARAPVLVPQVVKSHTQLLEALELVSVGRPIEYFEMHESLNVQNLFVIDPPPVYDTPLSQILNNRRPLAVHREAISSFRESLLEHVKQKPAGEGQKRLFLLRPNAEPRSANQHELLQVAEGFGFIGVRTDTMSFLDQVALFANAKFISGPSGAAFTNVLFSSQARALIFKASYNENENFFASLASIGGGRVFSINSGLDQNHNPIELSPARYKEGLQFLLQRE